jgi:hypothetical protein
MMMSLRNAAVPAKLVRSGLRVAVVLPTLPAVLLISGEVGAP